MKKILVDDVEKNIEVLREMSEVYSNDYSIGDISINNRNDIVIEEYRGCFKIYMKRPMFTYTEKSLANFVALVSFDKDAVIVSVKIKKGILIFVSVWYALFTTLSICLLMNDEFAGLIFILLMSIAPFVFYVERNRFKRFVNTFLNQHLL